MVYSNFNINSYSKSLNYLSLTCLVLQIFTIINFGTFLLLLTFVLLILLRIILINTTKLITNNY